MTLKEAKQIRKWRCEMGCTWRRVAAKAFEKWPEKDICNGNQIDGMDLCE